MARTIFKKDGTKETLPPQPRQWIPMEFTMRDGRVVKTQVLASAGQLFNPRKVMKRMIRDGLV